jgi:hypothetical protein
MNRHDVSTEGANQEARCESRPLGFFDYGGQAHAAHLAGGRRLFTIGDYHADGSLSDDGEFRVALVALGVRGRAALHPHLEAFGDGSGALVRAIRAGLLSAMEAVETADQFASRLRQLGMVDRSKPLPDASDTVLAAAGAALADDGAHA